MAIDSCFSSQRTYSSIRRMAGMGIIRNLLEKLKSGPKVYRGTTGGALIGMGNEPEERYRCINCGADFKRHYRECPDCGGPYVVDTELSTEES